MRWWDDTSGDAPSSAWLNSTFSTGLEYRGAEGAGATGSRGGWGSAQWMRHSTARHAQGNRFRRDFALNGSAGGVVRAFAYVASVGYFSLELDGAQVSSIVF